MLLKIYFYQNIAHAQVPCYLLYAGLAFFL